MLKENINEINERKKKKNTQNDYNSVWRWAVEANTSTSSATSMFSCNVFQQTWTLEVVISLISLNKNIYDFVVKVTFLSRLLKSIHFNNGCCQRRKTLFLTSISPTSFDFFQCKKGSLCWLCRSGLSRSKICLPSFSTLSLNFRSIA